MSTKEKLLTLLESRRGEYLSGEEIASVLSLSRASVWKAVSALRKEGYAIQAVTNRGYCLNPNTDILFAPGIRGYLDWEVPDLTVLPEAQSTNDLLRQRAQEGAPEGTVLLALSQSAGRGRSGREFFSPPDTGLYFSVLLRPEPGRNAQSITTMAAAAMCRTLETMGADRPGIKWVNDLFVRGRKVCGILTEGAFSLEEGRLQYAVLGVGLNLYAPAGGFPEPLADIAGPAFDRPLPDLKNRLAAEFLNRFFRYYRGQGDWVSVYRDHSLAIGREVEVLSAAGSRRALVLGIDDRCRLLVRYGDGTEDCLSYGEIRIRL